MKNNNKLIAFCVGCAALVIVDVVAIAFAGIFGLFVVGGSAYVVEKLLDILKDMK